MREQHNHSVKFPAFRVFIIEESHPALRHEDDNAASSRCKARLRRKPPVNPPAERKPMVCNLCGKAFDFWDAQEHFSINRRRLGYGTVYDGSGLNLRLCCDCLEHLIDSCKLSPLIDAET